eukprot:Nitzschia sp. Nitz4//scaffold14_size191712//132365//134479//NITZ4_001740-RA/size191712-processed-gene-0.66-mRNA-1//-1//CDS//3329536978//6208//frame0
MSSTTFRECPDGHRCENGALCVEASEGSYYCNCDGVAADVAGLSCEFEAETYCSQPDSTTATWFCTNQGTCVHSSSSGYSCDCPSEYEGSHCEFIAGTVPDDWPTLDSTSTRASASNDGLATGILAAILAVSAIVLLLVVFVVVRSVRRRSSEGKAGQNAPKDQSEALNIDMDGSGFRDNVLARHGIQSPNSLDHYDNTIEVDTENGQIMVKNNNYNYNYYYCFRLYCIVGCLLWVLPHSLAFPLTPTLAPPPPTTQHPSGSTRRTTTATTATTATTTTWHPTADLAFASAAVEELTTTSTSATPVVTSTSTSNNTPSSTCTTTQHRRLYLQEPFYQKSLRRVGWLAIFMGSLSLTALIINAFEQTLGQHLELAYFVPLLAGHGGNTGGQTVGAVLSAMSAGDIQLQDAPQVILQEVASGVLSGFLLAMVVAPVAYSFLGISTPVALVLFVTMPFVSTIASTLGASIPFVCLGLGVDPSVVAAPAMTSLVDVCGLVSYFSIARCVFFYTKTAVKSSVG